MRLINLIKFTIIGTLGLTVACSVSPEIDSTMAKQLKKTEDLKKQATTPGTPIANDVIRVKNDIWLGDASDVEFEGEPIPSHLETKDAITLISNRPITLYEVGNMIHNITSMSVRYSSEIEKSAIEAADKNAPSMKDIGSQWTDSSKIIINYKGPMTGLLKEISNRFNVWWKYERNELYFYKTITKTFVLHSLPTTPSISSGETGSVSNSMGDLDVWTGIEEGIKNIASDAKIVTDKANGTMTITATPTDIKNISKFIQEQNDRLSRQVAISVKVLQVTIADTDDFALNLQATLHKRGSINEVTFGNAGALSSGTGLTSIQSGISTSRLGMDAIVNAISDTSDTQIVTSGTVTTMNNKPAPIQVTRTENYISKITKTNNGDSDDYDLSADTDEVESGFTMGVLPRILDHGRILMFFNLQLSDLIDIQRVNLSGSSSSEESDSEYIQNPIVEKRGFTQEFAMKSGETLILSGFEKNRLEAKKSGTGTPENNALGGSSYATKNRSIIVVLLTPVVVESPLTSESRMN